MVVNIVKEIGMRKDIPAILLLQTKRKRRSLISMMMCSAKHMTGNQKYFLANVIRERLKLYHHPANFQAFFRFQ
jgi:predicted GTPase